MGGGCKRGKYARGLGERCDKDNMNEIQRSILTRQDHLSRCRVEEARAAAWAPSTLRSWRSMVATAPARYLPPMQPSVVPVALFDTKRSAR